MTKRSIRLGAALALGTMIAGAATAQEYGPGVSDTEIKIGQTITYTGPASVISTLGRVQTAYFDMINAQGGINGRQVRLLSLDDAYNPPRTVEQVRRLVEREEVLAISGSNGAATNLAVRDYLRQNGVPHLFLLGGEWNDPENYPMTTGATHSYRTEGALYGQYIMDNHPDATIAILLQNDDYGLHIVEGLRAALGESADRQIVAEVTYDRMDPTIDSQMLQLSATRADVFLSASYGKFVVQGLRSVADSEWDPVQFVVFGGAPAVMQLEPEERDIAEGVLSVTFYKNPANPLYADDADMVEYLAFLQEWVPDVQPTDELGVNGYISATLLAHALEQAGDNLTRENLVRQATNITDLALPLLPPGVTVTVTPDNYNLLSSGRMQEFNGEYWTLLDEVLSTD